MIDEGKHADLIRQGINLADERLGAEVLTASDEFFGAKQRMLGAREPEWRAGVYDENGKWMDGWETRRRRDQGHDHCVIRLAAPGRIALLEIDTRHFTGNYAPFASVLGCRSDGAPDDKTPWSEVLRYSAVQGNKRNFFEVESTALWTHLKLNIFPDGGVARFRAYGTFVRPQSDGPDGKVIDLLAALNGGRALACSDQHYGSMGNLTLPGRGISMADGWETRRRREPGFDWVILALGSPGCIRHVEIDTAHFKGNFPHQISINAALLEHAEGADLVSRCLYWPSLLDPQRLQADKVVRFATQLNDVGAISHVRINIYPDGGLSRVRLFGLPACA